MNVLALLSRLFRRTKPPQADLLIIGLGNPGEKYSRTRHNAGYRVVDQIAGKLANRKDGELFESHYIAGDSPQGKKVVLLKPLTFMNRSGESMRRWVANSKVLLSQSLVIVDDFNIPLGTIRLRRGGSHGGHNGLKSITSELGPDFPRLRIGIGPLPHGASVIDFVLGPFTEIEERQLGDVLDKAAEAAIAFGQEGAEAVMNKYNK